MRPYRSTRYDTQRNVLYSTICFWAGHIIKNFPNNPKCDISILPANIRKHLDELFHFFSTAKMTVYWCSPACSYTANMTLCYITSIWTNNNKFAVWRNEWWGANRRIGCASLSKKLRRQKKTLLWEKEISDRDRNWLTLLVAFFRCCDIQAEAFFFATSGC